MQYVAPPHSIACHHGNDRLRKAPDLDLGGHKGRDWKGLEGSEKLRQAEEWKGLEGSEELRQAEEWGSKWQ